VPVYDLRPKFVIIFLLFVNSTVHLYDEVYLIAVEISNESADYLLAAELQTCYLVSTTHVPKTAFCIRHMAAEIFS
jgi:hypothetical protein